MKSESFAISFVKYSIVGFFKHLLYWPLWWYSGGLFIALKGTMRWIINTWHGLALGIWLANIFRPMYGQYDVPSRIISFIMRVIQIIFRFIIMIILTAVFITLFIIYLILPPLSIWMLIKQY